MGLVVRKYGGSSLADVSKLHAVADQLAERFAAGERLVVVVSAMGRTTEELLGLARAAAWGTRRDDQSEHRRELDVLVSTGECVSMAALALALQARGVPAISLAGAQAGIRTSARHFDARIIDIEPQRIVEELGRGKLVVIAGYQGQSPAGEITTLGRGGSDTSAVALAAALHADRCEIYSDVDGVYSADPRRVPEAQHLPHVSYDFMQEAAEQGARVLNAQAVDWARRHGIVIHARRTQDGDCGRETRITAAGTSEHRGSMVVAAPEVGVVTAAGKDQSAVLERIDRCGFTLRCMAFAGGEFTAVVSSANAPLGDLEIPEARLSAAYGAVSVIGSGFDRAAGAARAIRAAGGLPVAHFASPLRLTFLVHRCDVANTERALHQAFETSESARASLPLAC